MFNSRRFVFFVFCCVLSLRVLYSQSLWQRVDSVVESAVDAGVVPGAVLCVVHSDEIVHLRAFGYRQVYPVKKSMESNTIFDLASLSKPVGTAMAVMKLIDDGRLSLEDSVSKYIPGFNDSVKVAHLLTHISGLPAYANASMLEEKYGSPAPDSLMAHISMLSHGRAQGEFRYSCLNFITLQHIVEVISGMSLREFYEVNIAQPMGLYNTCYCPPKEWLSRIAPTENIKVGRREYRLLHGEVHDPLARVMNAGNSGNAGLFSNASDLAKVCMFLMHPEKHSGPFSAKTVKLMTTVPEEYKESGRTYGWDSQSDYNAPLGSFFTEQSYSHSGYTGTSIAIDPVRDVAVILLTNRVHPKDKGSVNPLRRMVADEVSLVYALPDSSMHYVRRFPTDVQPASPQRHRPPRSVLYFPEPTKANKAFFVDEKTYKYLRKKKYKVPQI